MTLSCPGCRAHGSAIVRDGTYFRRCDSRHIPRLKCTQCSKSFSRSTHSKRYRMRRRRLLPLIQPLLCSGLSQRRMAKLLEVSRTTLVRYIKVASEQAVERQQRRLLDRIAKQGKFRDLQFDDLHTLEHTKCKPVAVCVVVDAGDRFILGSSVAPIPANGHLAAVARKKYGYRKDRSVAKRHELFTSLAPYIDDNVTFSTDEHLRYPQVIRAHFPNAVHKQYKSIKGCVTGQGELKKTRFDYLFSINHTLAMLRANINRLVRRTWCTTKKIDRLADHIALYIDFHNENLIKQAESSHHAQ